MNRTALILIAALLISCGRTPEIEVILSSDYEVKMISSGENRPAINLWKDQLREFLILLHHRIPLEEIQTHFEWTDEERERRIALLLENEFIKKTEDGLFVPTSMVISLWEGEQLHASTQNVAARIADLLEEKEDEIKSAYGAMSAFGEAAPDPSFFIMSDVILDNWQIRNIERDFIKAERTARHGVNYYHSVQEKEPESDRESFGIYGNQVWGRDSYMAGVYGNRRSSTRNLNSLRKSDMIDLFGMPEDADRSAFKGSILEGIVAYSRDESYQLSEGIRNGLDSLGLLHGDQLQLFVMTGEEYEELGDLADGYTEDLVTILEEGKAELQRDYERSRYAEEITFEEYLIWWYHFLYTEATNQLAERGVITIPEEGITTYVVDWGE